MQPNDLELGECPYEPLALPPKYYVVMKATLAGVVDESDLPCETLEQAKAAVAQAHELAEAGVGVHVKVHTVH
jgi:hypothetical protein